MKKAAIYTRVSTSMQAEIEYNSCDAQKDRIMSYIKSQEDLEFVKEYSDPGFSGASLERPAMNELLKDIADRKVDVVLTYKIDRLTRSSKDFYSLIEFFEKNNVSYVSVTERFDTSSPSGRLLRNIMLTFAQFEREMTSERIKDKFEQRAIKGMWNTGRAPFGYKHENKKIVIDKKKAGIVRLFFEKFVEAGSLRPVMDFIQQERIMSPTDKGYYSVNYLSVTLRNPAYIGKIQWNGKLYDGLHEPIISKELFEATQSLLTKKVRTRRLFKEYLLSKLVKCSACGSSMTNSFTNKKDRRYYYYKCFKVMRHGKTACSIKAVNAERLESFVIENLSRISQDKQYIENLIYRQAHNNPHHSGFEPSSELFKNLVNRVQQVLIEFKNGTEKSTQMEKYLIIHKTIQRINLSKDQLEVIISLEDTIKGSLLNRPRLGLAKMAARTRGAHVNPCAPDCPDRFDTKKT